MNGDAPGGALLLRDLLLPAGPDGGMYEAGGGGALPLPLLDLLQATGPDGGMNEAGGSGALPLLCSLPTGPDGGMNEAPDLLLLYRSLPMCLMLLLLLLLLLCP
jgi:hypothetical protein